MRNLFSLCIYSIVVFILFSCKKEKVDTPIVLGKKICVEGQALADIREIALNGNGVIKNVVLQYTGSSPNSALENIYLFKGNTRLTNSANVSSDGYIKFNNVELFTIDGADSIFVKADIANGTAGQIVGVKMISYIFFNKETNKVENVLNKDTSTSNSLITSAKLGSIIFGPNLVTSPKTVQISSQEKVFWSSSFEAKENSFTSKQIVYRLRGSAPHDAISNMKLFLDGKEISKSDNASFIAGYYQIVFDVTSPLISLGSHSFEVRGVVAKGKGRSFSIGIVSPADVIFVDEKVKVPVMCQGIPNNSPEFWIE
jgi:hypothetical protein